MGNWVWISSSSSNLLLSAVTTGYRSALVLRVSPAQGYSPLQLKALHAKYLLLRILPKLPHTLQDNKCIIESSLILFKAKSILISSAIQCMPFNQIAKRNASVCCINPLIKEKNKTIAARLSIWFPRYKKNSGCRRPFLQPEDKEATFIFEIKISIEEEETTCNKKYL